MANNNNRLESILGRSKSSIFTPTSFSVHSAAGIRVTEDEALKDPTVATCINILAQAIAQLDWRVYKVDKDGNRVLDRSHKVNEVLSYPNPYNTPYEVKYKMAWDMLSSGDSYTNVKRYTDGGAPGANQHAMSIYPLNPKDISVTLDTKFNPVFSQKSSGTVVKYTSPEMLHIIDLNKKGFTGTSRLQQAAELVGLSRAADIAAGSGFKNATTINGFLKFTGKLSAEQKDELAKEWAKFSSGKSADGEKKTPIMDGGELTFERLNLDAADMTLLEFKKYIVTQIAGLYRVPLHLLETDESGKSSTIAEKNLSFHRDAIFPLIKNMSERLSRTLLKLDDRGKYVIEFDTSNVSKGDPQSMIDYVQKAIMSSVMTPNEGRNYLGMNGVADDRMDEIFFQTSTQQLEQGTGTDDEPDDNQGEDDGE